ncbi:MAG: MBL fold metallo-hydrolase [Pseudomonadota bacterium]
MIWIKRGVIALALVTVVAVLAFNIFKKPIANALFNRVIAERVGVDATADLPDGLHVYICGAGAPMPDATRAGPCLGVVAGDRAYVFDIGSGGGRNLGSMGFPFWNLESVYFTHLHSDHIDGLGELMVLSWVGGSRKTPTPVIGPVGTQRVVDGFNMAYGLDATFRTAHHGTDVADPKGFGGAATELTLPAGPGGQSIVFEDDVLKITALRVEHAPVEPAFGYRIDYKDRAISISGDTIYHPSFVAASKGVDVMLHEALDPEMITAIGTQLAARGQANNAKIFHDILDYHATPEDAARSASEAGADQLILYHLVPPLPAKIIETIFLDGTKAEFDGPITVASDGMVISLPAGTDRIDASKAF